MQPVAGEELHPVESRELIVAQRGAEAGGGRDVVDAGEVLQFSRQLLEVRRRIDAKSSQACERGGVEGVETGFVRKFRVDQRGEVLEDFPNASDRQLQRVAIRQRGVDVAIVRPVECFLQEIILQQPGEDRQQVVALASHVEAHGQAEPPAISGRKLALPQRGIRLMHAMAHTVRHRHGPGEAFEAADHFPAELVPEGIGRHAAGIGKPAVRRAGFVSVAGFEIEEKLPRGVRLQRR